MGVEEQRRPVGGGAGAGRDGSKVAQERNEVRCALYGAHNSAAVTHDRSQ